MAIYKTGTISSIGSGGTVTGVGTAWTTPLTLIRPGTTLMLMTNPPQLFTVSDVVSATNLRISNPPAANITGSYQYSLLLTDGLSVDGLAQDVSESLRYWQTVAAGIIRQPALDALKAELLANINTRATKAEIAGIPAQITAVDNKVNLKANTTALASYVPIAGGKVITGAMGINGVLTATGANFLGVAGNTNTVRGSATVNQNLTVGGTSTMQEVTATTMVTSANANVGNQLTVQGALVVNGAVTFNQKLPVAQGGTGASTAAAARTNLGLGTAATGTIGANRDQVMLNGAWGLGGGYNGYVELNVNNVNNILNVVGERGICAVRNISAITQNGPEWAITAWGPSIWCRTADVYSMINLGAADPAHLSVSVGSTGSGWTKNKVIYHSGNAWVDGNGFIKKASPITSISTDGSFVNNDEAKSVTVTRSGVGVYLIEGCMGFHHDNGWKIEAPQDDNGSNLVWVDYKVLANGSIEVMTYHRTNDCPVPSLRNEIEGVANGDPIDIPKGKTLTVRINVPNDEYPEYVPPTHEEILEQIEKGEL